MTETMTYRALGFTDEITKCEHCGRDFLKGTVRMAIVDADGNEEGEEFFGVTCAARMSGRKAAEIRTEANRADRARLAAERAAYGAWRDAASADFRARRDAALGPGARPHDILVWAGTPEAKAAEDAWYAAHPMPEVSWGR